MESKIPTTLEECYEALTNQVLQESEIESILSLTEDTFTAQYHRSLGRWVRNNWNLWDKESTLFKHFQSLGLIHPDDMSDIILSYWYCKRKALANNQEFHFDFSKRADEYAAHWEKYKNWPQ